MHQRQQRLSPILFNKLMLNKITKQNVIDYRYVFIIKIIVYITIQFSDAFPSFKRLLLSFY